MYKGLHNEDSIMVIINPSHEPHIALERAIITSKLRNKKPKLHLFFTVNEESTDLKASNQKIYRDDIWFNALIKKITEEKLEFSFEFCWSKEWKEAILQSAARFKPDIIFVPDQESDTKLSRFSNSKWALLRSSLCPILIVRPGASNHRKKILAAINIQNETPEYIELNEKIISRGLDAAKLYNADFFVVNAYKDSMDFPDRQKIIKMTGLPSKNVHAGEGAPADVISTFANQINADMVLIGTKARSGPLTLMKGNTSAKVLNKLTQDIIAYS